MRKQNVLFLCTGNSARSQMGEAFLRRLAGDRFEVYSAGLEPRGVDPLTVRVMEEIGYDLSGQTSKGTREFMGHYVFHHVIIVCEHAQEHCPRLFPGALRKWYWPFDDPAAFAGTEEQRLAKFREVRDQIEHRLQAWLVELDAGDTPTSPPS